MRQEPSVYVNGKPVWVRPPNKTKEYEELVTVNDPAIETDEAKMSMSGRARCLVRIGVPICDSVLPSGSDFDAVCQSMVPHWLCDGLPPQ